MNFSDRLIKWYHQNKRDLPWRETTDPYLIWVSEVILQQTRVNQGLAYYERFIKAFPDIKTLALAREEEVLHLWQGLGYYSRARNMHLAAKQVVEQWGGVFPSDFQQILKLKGVGTYTAAAIASIAFGHPHAVLDGNVFRFLSRHFGIYTPIDSTNGKKEFLALAEKLLDCQFPGVFNQAMMEQGALVCKPVNPDCVVCAFRQTCYAHSNGLINELPLKSGKINIRNRYFNYLIFKDAERRLLIEKRTSNDIWKGLYQFPLVESDSPENIPKLDSVPDVMPVLHKHLLTHQRIFIRFWHIETAQLPQLPRTIQVSFPELEQYAIPRAISRYLEKYPDRFS